MKTVSVVALMMSVLFAMVLLNWDSVTKVGVMVTFGLTVAWQLGRTSVRNIQYERKVASRQAFVGETIDQQLEIRNTSRIPKLWLEFRDHSEMPSVGSQRVLTLRGRQSSNWTTSSFCSRRGRHLLGPATISGIDPFGLFGSIASLPGQIEVLVYPLVMQLPGFMFQGREFSGGRVIQRTSLINTPAVSTIRDYVAGDPLNRISWNTTAKLGRLMVKEFDPDPQDDVWVLVNLATAAEFSTQPPSAAVDPTFIRRPEVLLDNPVEMTISIAASIVRAALNQRRKVGLIVAGQQTIVLMPDQSERQFLTAMEHLAIAEVGDGSFAQIISDRAGFLRRQNSVVIVSPDSSHDWVDVVGEWRHRGVAAQATIVDMESFGISGSDFELPVKLTQHDIRFCIARKGQSLATSLTALSPTPFQMNVVQRTAPVHAN